jgi:hypothetical protein
MAGCRALSPARRNGQRERKFHTHAGVAGRDLLEEGARGIGAVARFHKYGQPTGETGILQGNTRDGAYVQIFDAVDRRRVNLTGARRRHHDKHGPLEPAMRFRSIRNVTCSMEWAREVRMSRLPVQLRMEGDEQGG